LTLSGASQAVLLSVLFGAVGACAYGLLGDFSDLLFGFWGTAALILVPGFVLLAWLLTKVAPLSSANLLALQFLIFGLLYPSVAGLDSDRQSLYFNLAAITFLGLAAWQLWQRLSIHSPRLTTQGLTTSTG
jgi:hypothetical protein